MRKIAFLMAALLGAAGGAVAEMQTRLLNDPKFGYAGAVLESGYVYEVRSDLKGLKATVPGQSALKVRPGASVVIKFYNKATLEVKGGDAFGPLPAGAGIEVPYGAKLVLAGDGTLIATGGNAAPGGQGYGGACGLEGDIKAASAMKPEDAPIPDPKKYENYERNGVKLKDFCSEAIHWAMVGAGGDGGDGGGGAGTGIGGRGGLGGKGGKGGEGQLVVGATQYNKRTKNYADFVKFFGIRNPYVFDGQTRVDGKYRVGSTGLDGQPGADGRGGCGCGEIIVADNVTINAISGASAAGGGNGSFGPTAKFKDESFSYAHYNSTAFGHANTVIGITSGVAGMIIPKLVGEVAASTLGWASVGVGAALSVLQLFLDMAGISDWNDLRKIAWLTGGGGGGGGGGGDSARHGLGAGGAGGGGGAGAIDYFDNSNRFLSHDQYGKGGQGGYSGSASGNGQSGKNMLGETITVNGTTGRTGYGNDPSTNWAKPGDGGMGGAAGSEFARP